VKLCARPMSLVWSSPYNWLPSVNPLTKQRGYESVRITPKGLPYNWLPSVNPLTKQRGYESVRITPKGP
jgi:hypothetical protein